MISKLNELTDVYNREEYDSRLVSATKYPGTYYKNLHELTKAFTKIKPMAEKTVLTIKQKKLKASEYEAMYQKPVYKVKFKYCEYDEHKQLKVRVTKNGEERVVNPVKLMWVNGFYYLVTYSLDKQSRLHCLNYRVDRMNKQRRCLTIGVEFVYSARTASIAEISSAVKSSFSMHAAFSTICSARLAPISTVATALL